MADSVLESDRVERENRFLPLPKYLFFKAPKKFLKLFGLFEKSKHTLRYVYIRYIYKHTYTYEFIYIYTYIYIYGTPPPKDRPRSVFYLW